MQVKDSTVDWLPDFDNGTDALGVVRRLLAAVTSAAERGGVTVGLSEVGKKVEASTFEDWKQDQIVTFEVTISSGGSVWGKRPYYFQGRTELSYDAFGVTRVRTTKATAVVLNGARSEGTRFTGEGVDYALSKLFRQVVLRDLALAGLGLREPLPEPQRFEAWAKNELLFLEFTGEAEVMPARPSFSRGERPSRPNHSTSSSAL